VEPWFHINTCYGSSAPVLPSNEWTKTTFNQHRQDQGRFAQNVFNSVNPSGHIRV